MRNEIPGLLTSSEIRETNLKPAGEVVIGVTTTIPVESKDEEGAPARSTPDKAPGAHNKNLLDYRKPSNCTGLFFTGFFWKY